MFTRHFEENNSFYRLPYFNNAEDKDYWFYSEGITGYSKNEFEFSLFDPTSKTGPTQGDTIHINSVSFANGTFHFSALRLPYLFKYTNNSLISAGSIPAGTHNTQVFEKGVILNNTENNCVNVLDNTGNVTTSYPIVQYQEKDLLMKDLPADHARQGFARGLCFKDDLIITGSSPATVSVYTLGQASPIKSINLTMDVRNAIHGLEIWPFSTEHIFD
jgi:hypothetical protein